MRKPIVTALTLLTGLSACASNGLAEDIEATQILRRAIEAVGGERSLARQKSPMMWMERGTFHGMGEGLPFVAQYAAKWPAWYRQEIEHVFVITVNGKMAWLSSEAGDQKLVGEQLEETLRQVKMGWAARLFPLTDSAYELSTIDGIQVDGRATVGIKASHAEHRDIKFFFDEETCLIAKTEMMLISPQHGPEPVLSEAFYTDHKSFGGVKMPSKLKLIYDQKLFIESEVVDYKMAATLDPRHFEEPE